MKRHGLIVLWLVFLVTACAGTTLNQPPSSEMGNNRISGSDVLLLRFHGADGKIARVLRVTPDGKATWDKGTAGGASDSASIWVERGGAIQPLDAASVSSVLSDPNVFVIGPGDVLAINVWKKPELSGDVPVRPDGKISLPLLADIGAAGMTAEQLKDVLVKGFSQYVTNPEVTVTVKEVRSYQIFIQGQVSSSGTYPIYGQTTLVQAISLAGGFSEFAARNRITILRPSREGSQRLVVNYDKIVAGDAQDFILRPGDTIIVP